MKNRVITLLPLALTIASCSEEKPKTDAEISSFFGDETSKKKQIFREFDKMMKLNIFGGIEIKEIGEMTLLEKHNSIYPFEITQARGDAQRLYFDYVQCFQGFNSLDKGFYNSLIIGSTLVSLSKIEPEAVEEISECAKVQPPIPERVEGKKNKSTVFALGSSGASFDPARGKKAYRGTLFAATLKVKNGDYSTTYCTEYVDENKGFCEAHYKAGVKKFCIPWLYQEFDTIEKMVKDAKSSGTTTEYDKLIGYPRYDNESDQFAGKNPFYMKESDFKPSEKCSEWEHYHSDSETAIGLHKD